MFFNLNIGLSCKTHAQYLATDSKTNNMTSKKCCIEEQENKRLFFRLFVLLEKTNIWEHELKDMASKFYNMRKQVLNIFCSSSRDSSVGSALDWYHGVSSIEGTTLKKNTAHNSSLEDHLIQKWIRECYQNYVKYKCENFTI